MPTPTESDDDGTTAAGGGGRGGGGEGALQGRAVGIDLVSARTKNSGLVLFYLLSCFAFFELLFSFHGLFVLMDSLSVFVYFPRLLLRFSVFLLLFSLREG